MSLWQSRSQNDVQTFKHDTHIVIVGVLAVAICRDVFALLLVRLHLPLHVRLHEHVHVEHVTRTPVARARAARVRRAELEVDQALLVDAVVVVVVVVIVVLVPAEVAAVVVGGRDALLELQRVPGRPGHFGVVPVEAPGAVEELLAHLRVGADGGRGGGGGADEEGGDGELHVG